MRFEEFISQPAIGDIIEIELGEEIVEAVITAVNGDEIVAETDSISGANLLVESYGKYWCSTDKKWKERQGPKQTRSSESIEEVKQRLDPKCWDGYKKQGTKIKGGVRVNNCVKESVDVNSLAKISDEALDKAYGYGRSSPGNTFGWQANVMSATYAKKLIDAGETDIEKISDAIHKGWNVTAQKFVQDPNQFDDTEKLRQAGKLDAKLEQRAKLMKINYAQLSEDEKEKDRVVARALLQAINGEQGVAESDAGHITLSNEKLKKLAVKWWNNDQDPRVEEFLHKKGLIIGKHLEPPMIYVGYEDDDGYFETIISWPFEELENSHVSEAEYQGRNVPLGKPMQGDVKKFKVYVRDPSTGNVKKVNFGDPNMRIKKSNPKRRKSFRARHNCSNPGPRTKARYWSCRKW